MAPPPYELSIFLNVPFDEDYKPIFDALIYAVYDCGFIPRSALEADDGASVRFKKVQDLIAASQFAIHDVSRTELDPVNALPRFNMPLELGLFIGAKVYGSPKHRRKGCLILDRERYRYQKFISDIAGHDIKSHAGDPHQATAAVRDWLRTSSGRRSIPSAANVKRRYARFLKDLPTLCDSLGLERDELTYVDYCHTVEIWLKHVSG